MGTSNKECQCEACQCRRQEQLKAEHDRIEEALKEELRYKGYLFWCSEGCGFVDRHHRCEQWSNLTYVPPELVKAIQNRKK